jgi:hypothetical protein
MTNTLRPATRHLGRYNHTDRRKVLAKLIAAKSKSIMDVANDHNISPSTLAGWVHRFLDKASAQEIISRGYRLRGKAIRAAHQKKNTVSVSVDEIKTVPVKPRANHADLQKTVGILRIMCKEILKVTAILQRDLK